MIAIKKCIPKDLVPHYGASLLQKSLRTKDRTQAVRISSNLVSALEREWQELRFSVPDGVAASDFLKSGVMLVRTLTVVRTENNQMLHQGRVDIFSIVPNCLGRPFA